MATPVDVQKANQAKADKAKRDALVAEKQKEVDGINASRSGKGLRLMVGLTRGKNPQVITYEAFDTDKPETLPTNADEFVTLTGAETDAELVRYMIDGFNSASYSAASDITAEFYEPEWDKEFCSRFKLAVTNYAINAGVELEDAVAVIKPGMDKAFKARIAAASAQ